MKKSILIIPFLFLGCGIVKKNKEETNLKTDSIGVTNLNKWSESEKYNFEPFDPSQPIKFVNSKGEVNEYFNTRIVHIKEKVHEQKKDSTAKKTVLKQEIKNKEVDNSIVIKEVAKWLALLIIVLFILNKVIDFVLDKIKRKTPII